jgi:kynurenine formamidase
MTVDHAHKFGKLALIDDAKRAGALSLVKRGRMYELGHVLDEHVPVFPGRYFKQTLVTTAHHANPGGGVGENEVNWITELVSGTMQLGTHLDALSHLQMGNRGYGGLTVEELADTNGVRHLGIETVPQIVTQGWLVDVSGLQAGEVIGTERCAGIDPAPGDAVLFHTGWSRHWDQPEVYLSGELGGDFLSAAVDERGVDRVVAQLGRVGHAVAATRVTELVAADECLERLLARTSVDDHDPVRCAEAQVRD